MLPGDMLVLHALRRLGRQRTLTPLAEATRRSSPSVKKALLRLERRGLVNIHRVELRSRKHIRWIVPVDVTWRGRHRPETTATNQGIVR